MTVAASRLIISVMYIFSSSFKDGKMFLSICISFISMNLNGRQVLLMHLQNISTEKKFLGKGIALIVRNNDTEI